jgi:hypothetical protein
MDEPAKSLMVWTFCTRALHEFIDATVGLYPLNNRENRFRHICADWRHLRQRHAERDFKEMLKPAPCRKRAEQGVA